MWQAFTDVRRWRAPSSPRTRIGLSASPCAASVQILERRTLLSGGTKHADPAATPASSNPIVPPLPTDLDLTQTFLLASRPSATKTIFLDFNGHVTTGKYWNSKYTRGASIVTPPYSIDANPAFSDVELATIQCIWQRVAEDFAPFDINVTSIEPSVADLIKSGPGDQHWGIRINVGGAYTDWLRQAAGGIAVLGSFGNARDHGAFVFTKHRLGEEKYTADCISHEVGHTLGLGHKGAPGSPYYSGHGSGDTGWAPLMGAAYDRALSQWSKGEYLKPTNRQDELRVITTGKGVNYRDDDYGSTLATASVLDVASIDGQVRNIQVAGVIERNTDQDWFVFATTGGAVALDFQPASRGANLDLLAALYDASGTLVATSNPDNRIDGRLELDLPAGIYYVMVDGVGARGLTDGYSDYGSLGQYTISGTVTEAGDPHSSGWITGAVWHDANRNGIAEALDQGLEGIALFLDLNDDGLLDVSTEPSILTDDQGRYAFSGLAAGDYVIRAVLSDPWRQITPVDGLGHSVNLTASGIVRNIDFTALNPPALIDDVTEIPVDVRARETRLAPGALVEDLDTANFGGGRLVVELTLGAASTDRLFLATGQITLARSKIRYRGKVIGTFSGGAGSAPLIVKFNSAATPAAVQAVVQSIAYRTTGSGSNIPDKRGAMRLFEPSGTSSNVLEKTLTFVDLV